MSPRGLFQALTLHAQRQRRLPLQPPLPRLGAQDAQYDPLPFGRRRLTQTLRFPEAGFPFEAICQLFVIC
jgi:hypothetical protein